MLAEKEETLNTLNTDSSIQFFKERVINVFSKLPHKILQNHSLKYLSQMVLHDICRDSCFGLKNAIYIIDNPDFDIITGVAGFCETKCHLHQENIWEDPENFCNHMQDASFNEEVQKFSHESLTRKGICLKTSNEILEIGKEMGLENPHFISWQMKYGNHGLLIFEEKEELSEWGRTMLANVSALLSLCGI